MREFLYRYICDCCGEEILGNRTLDLTADEEETFIIDLDMIGGFDLECPNCHHTYFIPDLRDYVEDITEEIEENKEEEE